MKTKNERKCSKCGKSGHNSRTCTAQPAVVEPVKVAPVTDEPTVQPPFDLNLITYRLLEEEPFFAALSRYVTKVENKAVQTAGVTVDQKTGNFVLYYNPDFFAKLPTVQRLGVLKHEFYHLVLGHCTGRKPTDVKDHKAWNFATDLAINSYLENELPEFCLFPGKGPFAEYPALQSAEWYFKKLKDDPKFNQPQECGESDGQGEGGDGQSGDGQSQFDDHQGWDKCDGSQNGDGVNAQAGIAREIAEEKLKDIMKKAAQEAVNRGNNWGTVSQDMRRQIMSRIQSKIDWRSVLRYFVRTSRRGDKINSIRKINKRYAYIHSGRKVTRHANIAISIDQSGSVGDDMLVAFFSELNKLAEFAEFTVIPFDCHVAESKIFVWKKNQTRKWERVLSGGTDFNAPTQYVNEHSKFDAHIILTDLEAPAPKPSKVQRLWITDEAHAAQPYFQTKERILAIPSSKK